jgi:hypothetical protein
MTLSTSFPAEFNLNDICRTLVHGMQEIVGPDEARDLFQQARSEPGAPDLPGIGALEHAFEERYGRRSGPGVAQRAGRASFKYGLRLWGSQMGMTDVAYQLLPPGRKVRVGLEKIGGLLNQQLNFSVLVSEDSDAWYWQVGCGVWAQSGKGAVETVTCHLLVGLLQEFVSWAGGSRFYRVVETECMANGADACLFQIDKKPIE